MIKTFCRLFFYLLSAFTGLGIGPIKQSEIRRVAIVMEGRMTRIQPQVNGLRDGLEELKYIEGKNLVLNLLQEETPERLRSRLKSEIQQYKVDVIVTLGTAETAIAREATPKIPIVFLPATDPVQSGFVRSLASPGTNLTGLTFFTDSESNIGKQLEVFSEVVPSLRRVLALTDGREDSRMRSQRQKRLSAVASRLGIELTEQPVMSASELTVGIAALPKESLKAGVFVVCSGLFRDLEGVASAAVRHRLPLFGCNAAQVAEQKVLLTYAPDLYSMGNRGAWFVDRILKGAKPESLAVETPTRFDLVINRKTAAEIGLKIPRAVLMLADRVFE